MAPSKGMCPSFMKFLAISQYRSRAYPNEQIRHLDA